MVLIEWTNTQPHNYASSFKRSRQCNIIQQSWLLPHVRVNLTSPSIFAKTSTQPLPSRRSSSYQHPSYQNLPPFLHFLKLKCILPFRIEKGSTHSALPGKLEDRGRVCPESMKSGFLVQMLLEYEVVLNPACICCAYQIEYLTCLIICPPALRFPNNPSRSHSKPIFLFK